MLPYQKKFIMTRDSVASDHAFLYSTYLQNNWYDKTNTTTLKKATWMGLQHKRLEKVLDEQKVIVACLSDNTDQIVGYGFKDGEKPFVYIKPAWRSPELDLKKTITEALEK